MFTFYDSFDYAVSLQGALCPCGPTWVDEQLFNVYFSILHEHVNTTVTLPNSIVYFVLHVLHTWCMRIKCIMNSNIYQSMKFITNFTLKLSGVKDK